MDVDRDRLGQLLGSRVPDGVPRITGVAYDSRAVRPGDAFVAVAGFRHDGTQFATQAVNRGAVLVVAESEVPDVPMAVVADARAALAALAIEVFGDPSASLSVYGVTGTNGKTTTAYALHAILRHSFGEQACGLMTTAEIVIGERRTPAVRTTGEAPDVQRSLAQMVRDGVRHVVLETSSHGIALQRVSGTHYLAALFTNLTRDHLDLHGTMEEYYRTKRKLFGWASGPKLANGEDEWGRRLAGEIDGVQTFGRRPDATYRVQDVTRTRRGTSFLMVYPGGRLSMDPPLLGEYNVLNVAGAAALALQIGVPADVVSQAVRTMPQVPGRFERVPRAGELGLEVVVDYAHTDVGLALVLQVAREVAGAHDGPRGRVLCVYGAAGDRDRAKRPLMGAVATELADVGIITTDDPYSEDPAAIADEILAGADPARHEVVLDRRSAIERALALARPGDVVVIAGKGHERVQHLPAGDVPFHDTTVASELIAQRAGAALTLTEQRSTDRGDQPGERGLTWG